MLVVRRRLPQLDGVGRVVGVALLATGAVVAAHMVPGVLGVLSRWTALLAALLLLAATVRLGRPVARLGRPPARPPAREAQADEPADSTLSWVIAGGASAALALWLLASAWNRTVLPAEDIDTLTIHFPMVGKWVQSGSMWQVHQFVPLLAHGNYPHTGDVVFLAAILPWSNDWLTGAVNAVYIAFAAMAVYAIARELGAPRPSAMLAGSLFGSVPVVAVGANGGGMTDSITFAAFAGALLFLLRYERGAPRGELWLAGLGLGLAFGTKWYGVWAVALVVAVWLAARLVHRRGTGVRRTEGGPAVSRAARGDGFARRLLRNGAVLAGLIAAVGGFWLLRNLVESGSPVFPSSLGPFDTPFDPLRACADFTVADYIGDGDAWTDDILPAYRQAYLWSGAAIGAGLLAAVALALRARRDPARGAVLAGALLSVLLALAYLVTPTSAAGPEGDPALVGANTRYLVPAIVVAAPLAGWALGRAGRLRIPLELACAAAVVYGIAESFDVTLGVVVAVLGVLVVLAGAAWLVLHLSRRLPHRARLAVLGAAITAALTGAVAIGHLRQEEFNRTRYTSGEPTQDWIARNAPEDTRIALAGVWGVKVRSPVWPAFGERIDNEVDFVGPTIDGQVREHASRERWAEALRDGDYDLVLVGRGGYVKECPVAGQYSDDDRWARAEGFERLARSEHLTLYRVSR